MIRRRGTAPGDSLHGFRVQQRQTIPELQLSAILLEHEATGAQHLHIDRDDANNVFAVGFQTPVNDSTGVPHVLEHTTLCGSQQYPVRDPFFKMLNRSMANYMNALTGSDYTIYPFATTNMTDYANLQSIYMDAVFCPKLTYLDFSQEGWRLEHDVAADSNTPIKFKGVVYNEMKGRTSDTSYLFYRQSQQAMLPGTTYSHVSGGDPSHITNLSYDQLKAFHDTYYHPSNARFYTYGNFPLEHHLAAIQEKLDGYKRRSIPAAKSTVDPWDQPRASFTTCSLDPMKPEDKQNRVSLSFLANNTEDVFETFAMKLLSSLLLNGHASPMYKALIDTNLGSEFSPNTGYSSTTKSSYLSIGLQGVHDKDIDKVQAEIRSVLEQVRRDGFDVKRIDAILHQMELGQKHKTAKFGLGIMNSITSNWLNGANPMELLQVNKHIDRFKQEFADGQFFESRIDRYLLNNPHTLTFVMQPDATYTKQIAEEEQSRLKEKIHALTPEDKKEIVARGQALVAKQDEVESLDCLPTLHLNDIATKQKRFVFEHTGLCNLPVQWRTTSTNGVTYFKAISTLPPMSDDLALYLPLFCDALLSLGTRSQTMADIDDDIRLYTGGLSVSPIASTNHSDLDLAEHGIILGGNCLDRNVDRMYSIFTKLIRETNFEDTKKLKTLIMGNASALANSIVGSGHVYARTYAGSSLTPDMHYSELSGGMSQIDFMNYLAALDDLSPVSDKLKLIASNVLHQPSLRMAVTCGEDAVSANTDALSSFIQSLPTESSSSFDTNEAVFAQNFQKTFFSLPYSVNFTSMALRGVPYTHVDGPKLQVLSSLMTSHHLHREIREKNGAYGGGLVYAGLQGLLSFYSYRDPNYLQSLKTYQSALDWLCHREFTDQEMTEAKLSIFQNIDAPLSVSSEGMLQFIHGVSYDMQQQRREQLFNVTQDDVHRVANKYLKEAIEQNNCSMTVLGKEPTEPQQLEAQGWKIRTSTSTNV
ncbi:peptidase M16C associated-domain-containing protein [Radiomyces spectabilis]|uniref:peptidase M16C associated-domain-containing protein n=1 Tax=Radiomyces spectabilis TaxID=64574 RepID=UPI00221E8501|nr:peptidase M16C associated-domain-containing protein [Radiomyces spectabilis]KAI8391039.1 peptidase M16C associated-domain-containing protein [Radiomyces spectabilis]